MMCDLIGICMLDINIQLMHGLKCMSKYTHIEFIVYVAW